MQIRKKVVLIMDVNWFLVEYESNRQLKLD